jgi:hypothetical protein
MSKNPNAEDLRRKLKGRDLVVAGKGSGWKLKKVLPWKNARLRVLLYRGDIELTTTPNQIKQLQE